MADMGGWSTWTSMFRPKGIQSGEEANEVYQELKKEVDNIKSDTMASPTGWKRDKTLLEKLKSSDKHESAIAIYNNLETLRVKLDGLEKKQKGIITYIQDRMEKNKIIDKGLTVSKLTVEYEDGKQITLDKDFFETVYSSRGNKFSNLMDE